MMCFSFVVGWPALHNTTLAIDYWLLLRLGTVYDALGPVERGLPVLGVGLDCLLYDDPDQSQPGNVEL
jgi:hypothetical protein